MSVAKGVTKLIVFEQDMAEMAHQKTITYDYHVYDHGTRECAREIAGVNKLVYDDRNGTPPAADDPDVLDRTLRTSGVGNKSFTCLTIDKVDAGFFDDWAANRAENLALLAEKYASLERWRSTKQAQRAGAERGGRAAADGGLAGKVGHR